ncbi:crotonase/enoyl-CoA hydratase family protein [Acinetobacter qingfengensis]|uniref:Enoyl-CoA hydratase n=1 Tax=Acinetobacter qingfengensis TaxID=1262585 RepID=A0A1E7QXK7_9GAMM|nr:crotonase/enoyl-CoA hydratase family protein [Acinetobacter qingfengensis]KAA8731633.1 crotonase/enoyl-CoA hydratase family protein [Acinetobacter qingfengensis]OEY91736.1 enoyl-CoA hydratase [Acinetobacter qingfengensis]
MTLIQLDVDQTGLAIVTLNRPDKRNAMSFTMLKALISTAKSIQKNRQIRCVIITGCAQVFSAGIDLSDLNAPKQKLYAFWQLIKPQQSIFQQACLIWQQLPVPVIIALEGYCFGAGLQLALAGDFRITNSSCQFSIMESRWGLVPDMGISKTLADLIGIDHAKDLTFSGRIISAEYAKQIGLVSEIHPQPLIRAQQLAQEYLQRSPDALMAAKLILNAMQQRRQSVLCLEKIWQLRLILGKNSRIARRKDKQPELNFFNRQR